MSKCLESGGSGDPPLPKKGLKNIAIPKKGLKNIVIPKKGLKNIAIPKKGLIPDCDHNFAYRDGDIPPTNERKVFLNTSLIANWYKNIAIPKKGLKT